MGSRGIRLAPGGRPPAARAGSLDRQWLPQKPLKSIGKQAVPWLGKRGAPAEGFGGALPGRARSRENDWKSIGKRIVSQATHIRGSDRHTRYPSQNQCAVLTNQNDALYHCRTDMIIFLLKQK